MPDSLCDLCCRTTIRVLLELESVSKRTGACEKMGCRGRMDEAGERVLTSSGSIRWGRGAVGSAPRWHRGGRGFESHRLHQKCYVLPVIYSQEREHGSILYRSNATCGEETCIPQRQLLESLEESRPLARGIPGTIRNAGASHAPRAPDQIVERSGDGGPVGGGVPVVTGKVWVRIPSAPPKMRCLTSYTSSNARVPTSFAIQPYPPC